MAMAGVKGKLGEYQQQRTHSELEDATPHRVVQMLMEGAIERVRSASGHMERKEIAKTGEKISAAISILDGLRASLDFKAGADIAESLDSLYEYMQHRLLTANIEKNTQYLEEVISLIKEIKSGWDAIPSDIIEAHAQGKLTSVEKNVTDTSVR